MKSLAELLQEHLLPMFQGVPWEDHPWWWPMRTGSTQMDYFSQYLTPAQIQQHANVSAAQLLKSVQGPGFNPSRANLQTARYGEFCGFWGQQTLQDAACVFVSDRPSRSHYPGGISTRLVNVLTRLRLAGVHFTDFIKRRGQAGSSVLPPGDSLAHHADILVAEIACLASEIPRICVIPVQEKTQRWLIDYGVVEGLRRQLGDSRLLLPHTYAVFWARHGWTMQQVCRQWSEVLAECFGTGWNAREGEEALGGPNDCSTVRPPLRVAL